MRAFSYKNNGNVCFVKKHLECSRVADFAPGLSFIDNSNEPFMDHKNKKIFFQLHFSYKNLHRVNTYTKRQYILQHFRSGKMYDVDFYDRSLSVGDQPRLGKGALGEFLPLKKWEVDKELYVQEPSTVPATRLDIETLQVKSCDRIGLSDLQR